MPVLSQSLFVVTKNGNLEKPERFQLAVLQARLLRIGTILDEGVRSSAPRVAELALDVIAMHASEAAA